MMLLQPKVRLLMEKMVKAGVPPLAAGMSLGMSAKSVGLWINCGMGFIDSAPKKPAHMDKSMECDGDTISEGTWYKHELECAALARAVVETEGKLVSGLVKRMWKNSGKNPDMMKFLFKNYTHAHGMSESKAPSKTQDGGGGAPAPDDAVQIVLPDNGRLLVKAKT